MKILVLGAGQVGSSIAEHLSKEKNDITVVDTNLEKLMDMQNRLDLKAVHGNASHPSVLTRAGAEDADMVVALTNSDEINMVACQVCHSIFHTPLKIARVRQSEYLDYPELFKSDHMPIDVFISPERLVTEHIRRLIDYPGALQVMDFAQGLAQLVGVVADDEGPLIGHQLREIHNYMPEGVDARVAAIFRDNQAISPDGDTVIKINDMVFFFAAKKDIKLVMQTLRHADRPVKKVILAGGGNIGFSLAKMLEKDHSIKVIENDKRRSRFIAEELTKALVIKGDCTSEEILYEENIDQTDIFCAITNDDQTNLLSALVAKKMGASKVLTLISSHNYAQLLERDQIDIAISPQHITIGGLLVHVRKGNMARIHSLRNGAAEAIEVIAHGDSMTSKVIGKELQDINLPPGTTIGGIIRGNQVIIAHRDVVVEHEDHIILFVSDKRNINDVERLFHVSPTFM
ncbi:MAG TPA: Trk system potassium transporter TrkA [Gammaproteobacteria bacterium]|nr:Trk system potassium transporter TrkA [Xanthomonadales bacterium]MCB1594341.1 Trk system potassium transporter TrkA [Xanthomonadales bacterium]HOP21989.1 Trk system potassium transporter TrkA [Gammaproteobacteria bacterium]HPI96332.1 Trk system potassium transporter TrkA [Gammaproteobacteria bacterium]HPQ87692.1 Trk system potassium transporter TrkA [Gammaproteobacteria bacterium]